MVNLGPLTTFDLVVFPRHRWFCLHACLFLEDYVCPPSSNFTLYIYIFSELHCFFLACNTQFVSRICLGFIEFHAFSNYILVFFICSFSALKLTYASSIFGCWFSTFVFYYYLCVSTRIWNRDFQYVSLLHVNLAIHCDCLTRPFESC